MKTGTMELSALSLTLYCCSAFFAQRKLRWGDDDDDDDGDADDDDVGHDGDDDDDDDNDDDGDNDDVHDGDDDDDDDVDAEDGNEVTKKDDDDGDVDELAHHPHLPRVFVKTQQRSNMCSRHIARVVVVCHNRSRIYR